MKCDSDRVLRLASRTAAGALVLLVGVVAASERSSAEPYIAKQTTTIRFSLSEKGHLAVPNGRELTRASGSGTLTIEGTPQENGPLSKSTSATGTIRFHRWRVVGGRVIDEDNLTMDVLSGLYHFTQKFSSAQLNFKVTTSDPKEKDNCPVGSTGASGALDGKVKSQPDSYSIGEVCGHAGFLNYGGVSGQRAAVVVTLKQGTP